MNKIYNLTPQSFEVLKHQLANTSQLDNINQNCTNDFSIASKIPIYPFDNFHDNCLNKCKSNSYTMQNPLYSGNSCSISKNYCPVISANSIKISNKPSYQRHKFSPEEDVTLNNLIAINGPRKWDQIALSMPGRTGRQCRDRFHNYLNPSLTNGPWTEEEDILLEQKVLELGPHWNKIIKFFKGRSTNNVKNRWYTYIFKKPRNNSEEIIGKNNENDDRQNEFKTKPFNIDNNKSFKLNNDQNQINTNNNLTIQNQSINVQSIPHIDSDPILPKIDESSCSNNHSKHNIEVLVKNNQQNYNKNVNYFKEKRKVFPPLSPPNNDFLFPSNIGNINFLI